MTEELNLKHLACTSSSPQLAEAPEESPRKSTTGLFVSFVVSPFFSAHQLTDNSDLLWRAEQWKGQMTTHAVHLHIQIIVKSISITFCSIKCKFVLLCTFTLAEAGCVARKQTCCCNVLQEEYLCSAYRCTNTNWSLSLHAIRHLLQTSYCIHLLLFYYS